MTKFNAERETLRRPIGEVAKFEPSQKEVSSSGEANMGPGCCNATNFGEA
jgi:hypothetical protein